MRPSRCVPLLIAVLLCSLLGRPGCARGEGGGDGVEENPPVSTVLSQKYAELSDAAGSVGAVIVLGGSLLLPLFLAFAGLRWVLRRGLARRTLPPASWGGWDAALYSAVFIIPLPVLSLAARSSAREAPVEPHYPASLLVTTAWSLLVVGVASIWARWRGGSLLREAGVDAFGAGRNVLAAAAALAAFVPVYGAVVVADLYLFEVLGRKPEQQGIVKWILSGDPAAIMMATPVVVFIAPILEEVTFRGFVYRGLRRALGAGPAIILSTLLFTVTHDEPFAWLPIFSLGLLLASLCECSGGLLAPMFCHALFNATNLAVFFLTEG